MSTAPAPLDEHLLLTAFFSLQEYLHWRTLMAPAEDDVLLAAWRRCALAAAHLRSEDGHPDGIRIEALPAALHSLAGQLLAHPSLQRSSRLFPARLASVELDRLVIYQRHVNLHWAEQLRRRWLELDTPAGRMDFCFPVTAPAPPVSAARLGPDTWVFTSSSQDLRVQESLFLQPGQLLDWTPPGPAVAIVGAAVGFGSNCLQAIQWGSRLILANGTHRAFALRQAGEASAPCLIQTAQSEEELALLAPALQENAAQLLTADRPPLLRDLFHPGLTERLSLPRRHRQVRISITVEELDLPAPAESIVQTS